MRFKADHDYHIHTFLSVCSNDEVQVPSAILGISKELGLKEICLTDHYWDETVPCRTAVKF